MKPLSYALLLMATLAFVWLGCSNNAALLNSPVDQAHTFYLDQQDTLLMKDHSVITGRITEDSSDRYIRIQVPGKYKLEVTRSAILKVITPPHVSGDPSWTITTLNGATAIAWTPLNLADSSLSFFVGAIEKRVSVDSILRVVHHEGTFIGRGMGYGLLGGCAAGVIIGTIFYNNSSKGSFDGLIIPGAGIGGTVVGTLGGAIVGATMSDDEEFSLAGLLRSQRIELLKKALTSDE